MPPDTSALPSVEFDFTDAEVKAVYAILSSLQPRQRSLISSVIIPLLLMSGLMAWAAEHNLSSNTFGILLILTTISYLAGQFALRYEIVSNARIRTLTAYKDDPCSGVLAAWRSARMASRSRRPPWQTSTATRPSRKSRRATGLSWWSWDTLLEPSWCLCVRSRATLRRRSSCKT